MGRTASRPGNPVGAAIDERTAPSEAVRNPQQLIWLFDQRFESLRGRFREHLDHRGLSHLLEVLGHELFPDVGEADESGCAHLRQRSPEEVNQQFLEAWDTRTLPGEARTTHWW